MRCRVAQHGGDRGADVARVHERERGRAHRRRQASGLGDVAREAQEVLHVQVWPQERPREGGRAQGVLDRRVPAHQRDRRVRAGADRRELDHVRDAGRRRELEHPQVLRDLLGVVATGEEQHVDAVQRAPQRLHVLERPDHDLGVAGGRSTGAGRAGGGGRGRGRGPAGGEVRRAGGEVVGGGAAPRATRSGEPAREAGPVRAAVSAAADSADRASTRTPGLPSSRRAAPPT